MCGLEVGRDEISTPVATGEAFADYLGGQANVGAAGCAAEAGRVAG
jgi:hypothetical protein